MKFIIAVFASFVVFLLLVFPARAGFWLFAPAGVSGFGFSGTLWNGGIQIVSGPGLQLRNTQWNLAPIRLLIGQLAARIETNWNGSYIEGFAAIRPGGNITLRNAKASFDAAALQPVLNTLPMSGQISIDITQLRMNGNWPEYAVADIEIRNLSSAMLGAGPDGMLGNYTVSFDSTTETDPGSVKGRISDAGGPLEVNGELLLTPPSQYALKVKVKARDDASIAMRRNLEFLGQAEPDGTRIFQLAGSI